MIGGATEAGDSKISVFFELYDVVNERKMEEEVFSSIVFIGAMSRTRFLIWSMKK